MPGGPLVFREDESMPLAADFQARLHPDSEGVCAALGLRIPELLLPHPGVDLTRWSVVACDQFTAEPEYWHEVERIVGDAPSSLRLTLPEIHLERDSEPEIGLRIAGIERNMVEYMANGVLRSLGTCMALVERRTPLHTSRWGLVLAIDLERYDFAPGNRELIRATEGTVLTRIPPRVRIRSDATLELPHVQLLFDDTARTVIGPLSTLADAGRLELLYDTELMLGGGHIRGFRIDGASKELRDSLIALSRLPSLKRDGLLFAVGDGNHSLATAKAHWLSVRSGLPEGVDPASHPARFALAEILDLNDPGLEFEPIHRMLFDAPLESLRDFALTYLARCGARSRDFESMDQAVRFARGCDPASHPLPLLSRGLGSVLHFDKPCHALAVQTAQDLIDAFVVEHPCRLDYIHGDEVVHRLSLDSGTGILLPALAKSSLFPYLADSGLLPRKSFSMGEAHEKRYYMEARRIR
jgi:hypothetical protein